MLSNEEIVSTFINTQLEGDYNFLQEDLVKIAHAFERAAAPAIKEAALKVMLPFSKTFKLTGLLVITSCTGVTFMFRFCCTA